MAPVTHLQIEPTTRCNFTCGFCCGRAMSQTDLAFSTFEQALATFPQLQQMDLQGEGEPLMNPRFFDMLRLARSRGIAVSFITNGSLLSADAVAQILDAGVEKISVSMESAEPDSFREIRGGKLEKVLAGIERLLAERRARGLSRPVVGLSVTVLKRTRGHLAGILALYRRLGLDGGVTLQPLQRMGGYTQSYTDDMLDQMLSDAEADEVWVQLRSNREIRRIQAERASNAGFHDHLMAGWSPSQRRCPWLEKGLYVDRDGYATACCMIKDRSQALGQLGVDSVETLMARRDTMRQALKAGEIPSVCSGCELARFAVMTKLELIRFALAGATNRLRSSRSRSLPVHP